MARIIAGDRNGLHMREHEEREFGLYDGDEHVTTVAAPDDSVPDDEIEQWAKQVIKQHQHPFFR